METQNKVDLILQYSLLVAGQSEDYRDRSLGPIHLIKYVYIADLLYARSHNGETFTGISWLFHKFGPWAQEVNARIEPALSAIFAGKFTFPSDYKEQDEWYRWEKIDEELLQQVEKEIPLSIQFQLARSIKDCGQDTSSLLNYVYLTPPMRIAAPGEYLDFQTTVDPMIPKEDFAGAYSKLTSKQQKNFRQGMNALQERNRTRQKAKRGIKDRINSLFEPIQDEVYQEGMAWLDNLAGEPIQAGDFKADFDESIWKSPTRISNDFS